MRQHPAVGERIVASIDGLAHLRAAVRAEHERWDGSGYPDGLAGEAIPLASRICLACDAYDAMTTDRPYRSRLPYRTGGRRAPARGGPAVRPAGRLRAARGAPDAPVERPRGRRRGARGAEWSRHGSAGTGKYDARPFDPQRRSTGG